MRSDLFTQPFDAVVKLYSVTLSGHLLFYVSDAIDPETAVERRAQIICKLASK